MTITYTKEHCSRSVPMEAEIHTKKLKSAVALTLWQAISSLSATKYCNVFVLGGNRI